MPRITYQDFQNSRIPPVAGQCPTSAKLLLWLNEAEERLLYEGKWWGTYSRVRFCATDGCLTLPTQLANIESAAICDRPIPIRDNWYEFLENGMGIRSDCSCFPEAIMRGNFPVFTDISGSVSNLLFVCDLSADVGQTVLALGYDQNGNWIRTQQNGVWADGELITMAQSPGTLSVNIFTTLTDLQFTEPRDGQCWLYSKSTVDSTQIMLGHYQYNEMRPSYARYFLPSVQQAINAMSGSSCTTVQVETVCKHAFVPVVNPTDYLNISCLPALKEMIIGIKNAENTEDGQKANAILATATGLAKAILDKQLQHQVGSPTFGITIQGSGGAGDDCVPATLL